MSCKVSVLWTFSRKKVKIMQEKTLAVSLFDKTLGWLRRYYNFNLKFTV